MKEYRVLIVFGGRKLEDALNHEAQRGFELAAVVPQARVHGTGLRQLIIMEREVVDMTTISISLPDCSATT